MIAVEPFYEDERPGARRTFRGVPAALTFVGVPRAFIHGYGTPADLDGDVGLDCPTPHQDRGTLTSRFAIPPHEGRDDRPRGDDGQG